MASWSNSETYVHCRMTLRNLPAPKDEAIWVCLPAYSTTQPWQEMPRGGGAGSSSCQPKANGRTGRKGQWQRAPHPHPRSISPPFLSDLSPSALMTRHGQKVSLVNTRQGEHSGDSKVTSLIKPSQIKYCLCRQGQLPACFGNRKLSFSTL